jgi:hypothetical protein
MGFGFYVRQQAEETSALDRLGEFALLLLADTAVMRDGTILPRSEM